LKPRLRKCRFTPTREVGPAGQFFRAARTRSRHRAAFFPPSILDWRDNEPRSEASSLTSVDAVERAVADRSRNFVAPLKVERLGAR
jgi:trimethylamine:corrinoid methyltransferase-like protein